MPDETITREILGNVPAWLVTSFYVAAAATCGLAAIAIALRLRRHRLGTGADVSRAPRRASWASGLVSLAGYLAFHRALLRDPFAGVAHLLTFYGFLILFIGTCLVAAEHQTPLHFFYGNFYIIASLVIDLGGVALMIGLSMFLWRRFRQPGGRFLRAWWVTALSVLLLLISLTGFLLEGARIAQDMPVHERWSVAGYGVAVALQSIGLRGEATLGFHQLMWATHAVLCVLFFALLPWKFFGHIFYAAISWATRSEQPIGKLRHASIESTDRLPGALTWKDLAWHDLLESDACTTCGRCNDVCPAMSAGKPLRPREVVLGVRAAMHQTSSSLPLSASITDDAVYSCTTCGACNEACPVGIDVYGKIVEMRRGRVETGAIPETAQRLLEHAAVQLNPFDRPHADRMLWATELDVPIAREGEPIELLYWVGCAGSFDPDGQTISRHMVRILNHLGIEFHMLGTRERCTGDPARRMGEEGLFQELASENIARFGKHSVRRILTHCPHCFNTFANEYTELGGNYQVEHHSQFLARMIHAGRLRVPQGLQQRMTFHDPCYLGRGNGLTQPPRDTLGALPGVSLVEMPRTKEQSFCCGAGGGSMWLDIRGRDRVENLRIREAAATGAATVATACPFCKSQLQAGFQDVDDATSRTPRIRDLAELVADAEGL